MFSFGEREANMITPTIILVAILVICTVIFIIVQSLSNPYNYAPDEYLYEKPNLEEALKYVHDPGVCDDVKLVRGIVLSSMGNLDRQSIKNLFREYMSNIDDFKKQEILVWSNNLMKIRDIDEFEVFMKYKLEKNLQMRLTLEETRMLLYTKQFPSRVLEHIRILNETAEQNQMDDVYTNKRFATFDRTYEYLHDPNISEDIRLIRAAILAPDLIGKSRDIPLEDLKIYMAEEGLDLLKSKYKINTLIELENVLINISPLGSTLKDAYMRYFVAQYRGYKFDSLEQAFRYIHDKSVTQTARLTRALILARSGHTDFTLPAEVDQLQPILVHLNKMYNIRRVSDLEKQLLKILGQRGYYESVPSSMAMKMLHQTMYVKDYDSDMEQVVGRILGEIMPKKSQGNIVEHLSPNDRLKNALYNGSLIDKPNVFGSDNQGPHITNKHNGNRFASVMS